MMLLKVVSMDSSLSRGEESRFSADITRPSNMGQQREIFCLGFLHQIVPLDPPGHYEN
jgi:hypothetical protein